MPLTPLLLLAAVSLPGLAAWIYLGLRTRKIRNHLQSGFTLMALSPALIISAGTLAIGYSSWQSQALTRLESAAELKETRLTNWLQDCRDSLLAVLNEEYATERVTIVLSLANVDKRSELYQKAIRSRLERFVERSQAFEELFLLDLSGRVIVSTDLTQEGHLYEEVAVATESRFQTAIFLPFGSNTAGFPDALIALPVTGELGELLGSLAGRAPLAPLTAILDEQTGLGQSGRALLVDAGYRTLAANGPGQAEATVSQGMTAVIEKRSQGAGVYAGNEGRQVIGVYRWLTDLDVGLLLEQDQSEALQAVATTLGINALIVVASVLAAVGAAWLTSRTLVTPLVDLVTTAKQIAAGDLQRTARGGRLEEIGDLAEAFNSMTRQLRDSINGLEQRVRERTEALRQRAIQMETSAQVSRKITSILEIDDLLTRVVELIWDAFGYYHVNVYLINEDTGQLVLRARSGAQVPEFQTLDLSSLSLNSEAARLNEVIVLNDVAGDTRYRADRQLPDTRAEVVLPLRAASRLIGTMDVNSDRTNAFTQEDVLVLQSLADQIAIAIENARLYEQSRELAVLEERHRLAQELHDSVKQSLFSIDLHAKAVDTYVRQSPELAERHIRDLRQITHGALQEMRALIFDLHPVSLEENGLAPAIRQHIQFLQRSQGLDIRFEAQGDRRLPRATEKHLYRIAQEALSNAVRHAQAERIQVRLTLDAERVELCVQDDGRGFEPDEVPTEGQTFGLAGMRERAALIHGQLWVQSRPGEGCLIRVVAPGHGPA